MYYEGFEGEAIRLLNENTVETVCLLGKQKPDAKVKLSVNMDDYYRIKDGKEKCEKYEGLWTEQL